MDISGKYLGLGLKHPVVASSSILTQTLEGCKKLEDSGVSAVVLHSLFEEQIARQDRHIEEMMDLGTHSYAEALTYFPEPAEFIRGPQEYLNYVASVKDSLDIPVIASLNGQSRFGWCSYAKHIEQAGADALELNVFFLSDEIDFSGAQVEQRVLDILSEVKQQVSIPVSVKLSPFFAAPLEFVARLDEAGADGVVLFNRFYQPGIDVENLDMTSTLNPSSSADIGMPLRWTGVMYGRVGLSLGLSTGVHTVQDVVKAVMAGADAAMVCSAFIQNGPGHAKVLVDGLVNWLEDHGYEDLSQLKGSMSQLRCPNPEAYRRANYIRTIVGFDS